MFWNKKSEIKKFPELANGIPIFIRLIVPAGANLNEIYSIQPGKYLLVTAASIFNNGAATLTSLEYIPNGIPNLPSVGNGFIPGAVEFLGVQNGTLAAGQVVFLERSVVIPERSTIRLNTNLVGGVVASTIFVVIFALQYENETPLP